MKLPSATIWPDMIQGSEEWFRARAGRSTASRFAKILTPGGKLSAQADDLARVLARESVMADPQEWSGNKYTDWGNDHEPSARNAFAEQTGAIVHTVGFCTNNANPVLGCSPDGLVFDPAGRYTAGLEIKCPTIDTLVGWLVGPGGIPNEYLPQVHGSMVVTGLRRWEFVGYHPGNVPLYRATAEWNDYTDKLAAELDDFVIRYAAIRRMVLTALGRKPE